MARLKEIVAIKKKYKVGAGGYCIQQSASTAGGLTRLSVGGDSSAATQGAGAVASEAG